jgi:uncharacterized protein (DUF433 family)
MIATSAEDRPMSEPIKPQTAAQWKYLAPGTKTNYKGLFVKGRRIRAETLYGWTVDGSEPMTPEQVAESYGLPLEAVQEAIAYCASNPPEIVDDHRREEARMRATGMLDPGYSGQPRVLTAQEIAELRKA